MSGRTILKNMIMAVDNMISLSFTDEELQTIDNALATIEGVMSTNLSTWLPTNGNRTRKSATKPKTG